jgi:hypothetical protein
MPVRPLRVAALAALLSLPSVALANGRFPAANQLVTRPGDPSSLLVRATFGLLVSADSGAHFDWVCEQAVGLDPGADQDPPIALLGNGFPLVAPFDGVRRSTDGGCSFEAAATVDPAERVIDVAVDPGAPARGVAVTWHPTTHVTTVYETTDGGASWQVRGTTPGTDAIPVTLDLSPAMPSRILVSGAASVAGKLAGVVARSDDDGATWERFTIPFDGDSALYLAALDPADAGRVYARTTRTLGDRLLVSDDGGATFTEALRTDGRLLGFALAPDGSRVAVGGPTLGVQIADRTALQFSKQSEIAVTCLSWSGQGLLACGSMDSAGFAIGLSPDGASWTPLLPALSAIRGPLASCPAASPEAATCAPLWPGVQALFGPAAGSGGSAGSGGNAGSGASAGGGVAGQTAGAGAGGGGGAAGLSGQGGIAGQGGAGVVDPPAGEGDFCSCASAGQRPAGRELGWGLGLAVALVRGRRARRGRPVR